MSPGPPALALPGQEERPRADIDILVGAGQAAAVLFQVVPGILVELGHLAGEVGFSETDWDTCSQRAAPGPEGLALAWRQKVPAWVGGGNKQVEETGSWKESHLAYIVTRVGPG